MSRTLDVNLLLAASDTSSTRQPRARRALNELTTETEPLYLFWPVLLSFLRIATHQRVFDAPLTPEEARTGVKALLEQPVVRVVGEDDRFWPRFEEVCSQFPVRGVDVPDAHLVALMRLHEVRTIWTNDRDFRRYDGIRVHDPFV